jgi:hypothetical protein
MAVPAVWDIKIRNRRTNVWIHASEDEWCKKEEVEPGRVWRYKFEYFKPPTPHGIRPDYDYDEPVLRITKTNNTLEIFIEDFGGIYTVDIYAFGSLLWADVGGPTRRHVGSTKTIAISVPPAPPPPAPPAPAPTVVELGDETITRLAKAIAEALTALGVVPYPTGRKRKFNQKTTTSSFQTIVDYTPTSGKKFHLTKIVVSCLEDVEAQLYWKGEELTIIYKVMGKMPFTDWFPWDFRDKLGNEILGDGNSKIELKARYPSGGAAAECYGEIIGMEEA